MATEADKTNTGVVLTAFAVGTAAMIGGTAAIVGMVRTEVGALNEVDSVYANHAAIRAMHEEQTAKLNGGKLPINRAAALVIADLKRDPQAASPYTKPAEVAPSAAPAEGSATPASGSVAPASASPAETAAPAAPKTE
jgi:hypothetical protein